MSSDRFPIPQGTGTQGQMGDNIRAVQNCKPLSTEESADVRKRAVIGSGVYTGRTLEHEEEEGPTSKPDMETRPLERPLHKDHNEP